MKTVKILCVPLVLLAPSLFAHSPIFQCSKNQNGSITCTAGFTDGTSGMGSTVRILDMRNIEISSGIVGEDAEYTFTPPASEFHVVFDGGINHQVTIYSGDIQ